MKKTLRIVLICLLLIAVPLEGMAAWHCACAESFVAKTLVSDTASNVASDTASRRVGESFSVPCALHQPHYPSYQPHPESGHTRMLKQPPCSSGVLCQSGTVFSAMAFSVQLLESQPAVVLHPVPVFFAQVVPRILVTTGPWRPPRVS